VTRAFVALRPPDAVLDAVQECVGGLRSLGESLRWAPREQWHVTLQFLGDADIGAVSDALAGLRSVAGEVQLGGGGAFSSARRASVCWIGLVLGAEWCASLTGAVGALLAPLGHEPEARRFHAHLTVARVRGRASFDARELVARVPAVVGEPWTAREVTLYESRLSPKGATYVARASIPLT
jgi:2'-5' RNA ligase